MAYARMGGSEMIASELTIGALALIKMLESGGTQIEPTHLSPDRNAHMTPGTTETSL